MSFQSNVDTLQLTSVYNVEANTETFDNGRGTNIITPIKWNHQVFVRESPSKVRGSRMAEQ